MNRKEEEAQRQEDARKRGEKLRKELDRRAWATSFTVVFLVSLVFVIWGMYHGLNQGFDVDDKIMLWVGIPLVLISSAATVWFRLHRPDEE